MEDFDFILINKYPELFGVMPFDSTTTLMEYGLECGEGWHNILTDLFEKISIIVKNNNLESFKIVQVKSKFGGLRVYTENSTKEINALIRVAEDECSITCEKCGASSKPTSNNGWLINYCEDCLKKIKGDN
jgi:hypothetical protein